MANKLYKSKAGQEVVNYAPTPTDPNHIANKAYVDANAGSGGTSEIPEGAFTGVLDVSGGNRYYDDYTSGAVVNLSLSATKSLGATATVRIAGDLTGTIPSAWNFSGRVKSTLAEKINELTVLYKNDTDVRIVNRVFDNPNYVSPYVVWEDVTNATVEANGTIGQPTVGGWVNGGYGSMAMNGNNALLCESASAYTVIIGLADQFKSFSPQDLNREILAVLRTDGTFQILEDGTSMIDTTGYTPSQTAGFRITDGVVTFEVNGTTLYTSAKTFTLPLTPLALLNNANGAGANSKILNARYDNTTNLVTSPI